MKSPVYLNALRAFEASARHGSFSGAAAELGVTPAAVGQLVRTLEEWLGVSLFNRATTGKARLVPTALASRALPDLRAGFDRLTIGLERLKDETANGLLTVTVSPAFAAKWLLPRIDRFQSRWPDIDVRLDTNLKLLDYVALGLDIGVRYGGGTWPGLVAEFLMDEEVYPVCSPTLAKARSLKTPADLGKQTLIHDQSVDPETGFETWASWLAKAGVSGVMPRKGLKINNSAAVLQAAIEGHGVALARSILAQDDIAAGRLIRLFPKINVQASLAYYVVYRSEASNLPRLTAFRDWLFAEATAQKKPG
ncbi:transcriptional regulator GcvA [Bradyrhizobium jicamae]|uniref:Transcriptional regulator GcvA n=1 Tax=Bradyrhizobium jicamae TaxID=280332 RepID=A0ABS5FSY7_9BRAD|nr:transcriptional regulator GcvA [Bradyrhizobium jicamae]MBR0799938.1 transcriptional regulator GcvA [Bradyrhizobium jicamae]